MKIEVEIDDDIARILRQDIFGEGTDLGVLIDRVLQSVVVTWVTDPEGFQKAFGEDGRANRPPSVQAEIIRLSKGLHQEVESSGL